MTKILFESTKDLYIEKLYRRYQESNTLHMHSIVLKIVIKKTLRRREEEKSCKHVRSYAATIEDRINILNITIKEKYFDYRNKKEKIVRAR